MKIIISAVIFATILLFESVYAAEYQGSDVDGNSYTCTAFSYGTGKYYYLTCEFSGTDIYLYFANGGHIVVSMDDQEIDDPSSISAFDYNKGNYWDLDVDM
ncbi:MAG: hypothetical protein ACHQII_05555 [Bacteroidia bacterium]